jgi:lysyl-tRNA synthetase class 2
MKRIFKERQAKLDDITARGVDPYPYGYMVTHHSADVKESFDALAESEETVSVAGRVMALRPHGKTAFANLRDLKGDIQVYFRKDEIGDEKFGLVGLIDVGDIVGVKGTVFKTRTEEITVKVSEFELLTKSMRPLPEKWHGLKDKETRYRQRYVDLFVNLDVRETVLKRAAIIATMRRFLDGRGFIEVETPILQPIYGGASAQPFTTFHNALDMKLYLRIADELYLKRLLVGGLERVYEFCKDFRNEGVDKTHSPEFTMLELYQAYADYNDMMDLFEEMMETVCLEVLGTTDVTYQGKTVSFKRPWKRITVEDAYREYAGIDVAGASDDELRTVCAKIGEGDWAAMNRFELLGEILDHLVEPNFTEPTFLHDYPVETSPLAKRSRRDKRFTERFEPFAFGVELGNAFSELNDPAEQRARFEEQKRLAGEEEMDHDFLRSLEYGMPPAGGLGVGIDRVVMILTDSPSIRDVILFPPMRPEAIDEDEGEEEGT